MWEHEIMTDHYFLCLYKIWALEIIIKTSVIKPGSWHLFGSTTDDSVVKWEVLIFAINLSDMSLDDFNHEWFRYLVLDEHFEHGLIPPEFFLCFFRIEVFGSCECKILIIAEIKVRVE